MKPDRWFPFDIIEQTMKSDWFPLAVLAAALLVALAAHILRLIG